MMKKYVLCCLVYFVVNSISLAQCDHTLKPSDNPSVAYKTRGNRCEGTYAAKVGAPSLDVVGFTIGKFSYKLEKSESITIENSYGFNFFIRASAIPLNTYYRMDASLGKGQTLTWQIKDVLFNLTIPSNSLGVYGWSGTEKEKVFIPVKAVSSTYNPSDDKLYLLIRPSSKILGVKFRYAQSDHSFSAYETVNGASRQLIVIVLPEDLKGQYSIEVAAMLESKSDWVINAYQLSIQ